MATITEDYVSFEIAKLLKKKGFEGYSIFTIYDENAANAYIKELQEKHLPYSSDDPKLKEFYYTQPTLQMAMKWLREVHNIDIVIDAAVGMLGVKAYVPFISTYKPRKDAPSKVRQIKRGIYYKDDKGVIPALQHFDSYEEACEEAIKYCLENLI